MGWIVRFLIIAICGTTGAKAIEEHKVAGTIFFLLSLGGVLAMLNELGVIDVREFVPVIAQIAALLVGLVEAIVDAITG